MLPPPIAVLADVLVFEMEDIPKMLLPAVVVVETRLLKGLIPMLVTAEDAPPELLLALLVTADCFKPNMPPVVEPVNSAALALVTEGTEA